MVSGGLTPNREFNETGWCLPTRLLLIASVLAGVFVVIAVLLATRVHWLGIELAHESNGIRVVAVNPQGPSDGLLASGDLVQSLRASDGRYIPLTPESQLREQQVYRMFARNMAFTAHQKRLFDAIESGVAIFRLADGREVTVELSVTRPIGDLPSRFWAMTGASICVLLVGIGIWSYSRGRRFMQLVLLGSVAYFFAGLCLAIYGTREWLLEPELVTLLTAGHSLCNLVATFSLISLLWYYPRRLGNFPLPAFVLGTVVVFWLNSQLFPFANALLYTYHLPCLIAAALAACLGWRQLTATRLHPRERAALLWYLLSIAIGLGVLFVNYLLPELHRCGTATAFWLCQIRIPLLYVGLIFGVVRFRLFDLERWWFAIWIWFFAGLLVVFADVALVYYANIQPAGAVTLSLLLVGWVYFPIREWAWGRFTCSPSERLQRFLPMLLEAFFAASVNKPLQERWRSLLSQVFHSLNARCTCERLPEPSLGDDGFLLAVPDIGNDGRIVLSGRNRGTRLFTRDDVRLASILLIIARKSVALREAQERGAATERERIARDLHDDVAPKLLTLAHRAPTPEYAEEARAALHTLRESIYTLSDPSESTLEATLAEWRFEVADRTDAAGVVLSWRQPEDIPTMSLTSRQRLNLGRVLREAVTNALKHAQPEKIDLTAEISDKRLIMRLMHDGKFLPPDAWQKGKGVNNMRTRITELGGQIDYGVVEQPGAALLVCWQVNLTKSELPTTEVLA